MHNVRRALLFVLTGLALSVVAVPDASGQTKDRPTLLAEIETLRQRITAAETTFLAPAAEDLSTFADFLKQPNTGLTRLMPRETYDKALLIRGGGAYFAFIERKHEYGFGSDIALEQNMLQTGFAGADFGFLTALGQVPVSSITDELAGVRFLADFVPPATLPDARVQQSRAGSGFEVDGFNYKDRLPVAINTTYALRSINYSRWDVLVVFNITRKDADGSLILAWKVLRTFPTPNLAQ
jgi:hypothetical protein